MDKEKVQIAFEQLKEIEREFKISKAYALAKMFKETHPSLYNRLLKDGLPTAIVVNPATDDEMCTQLSYFAPVHRKHLIDLGKIILMWVPEDAPEFKSLIPPAHGGSIG